MDLSEKDNLGIEEEMNHWWIKTRFLYLSHFLNSYLDKKKSRVIEFGCGSGQNLIFIRKNLHWPLKISDLVGFDPQMTNDYKHVVLKELEKSDKIYNDLAALKLEQSKGELFDLAISMDVLEHIKDEDAALQSWRQFLHKDAYLFITVPAFSFLWSKHYEKLQHFRRYTKDELIARMEKNNFKTIKIYYIFKHLLPILFIMRKLFPSLGSNKELQRENPIINTMFTILGYVDFFTRRILPIGGSSVMGIFQKRD